MNCPRCSYDRFQIDAPCPECGFQADVNKLENLGHIVYLLGEIESWQELPTNLRASIQAKYQLQQRRLERELKLRPAILSQPEAQAARLELTKRQYLLRTIRTFFIPRQIHIPLPVYQKIEREIREIETSLLDAPVTPKLSNDELTLHCHRYAVTSLDSWITAELVQNTTEVDIARQILKQSIADLEIQLGIRSKPESIPAPIKLKAPEKVRPQKPPKAPRQPWTWDRFLETLLSERTLQAMLFLGVGLLVAAAVSLVVWNWNAFPPLMQVGFLALFTATFYVLGWYVRVKLKLRRSGIALSAFASLLVPLEIYAIYLSGGFPAERWAEVWWAASLACLIAYLATVYAIQAEFFGYLVVLAGGSLLCATLELVNIPMIWWQVGLAIYALTIYLASMAVLRRETNRLRVMGSPSRHLALIGGAVILVWDLGLGLTAWRADISFRLPLALTWWLGGLLFSLAAKQMRSHTFSLASVLIYPIAVIVTESFIFPQIGWGLAWYALGPAILTPIYLGLGRWLQPRDVLTARALVAGGRLLVTVSAVWALFDVNAAAFIHPILAVSVFLAARWWSNGRLIYLGNLLLLTTGASYVAGRGLPLGQTCLAWGLLSIVLIAVGVRSERFRQEFFASGWLAGLFSLLPGLIFFERGLLIYALGNWTAINAWLALLAHEDKLKFRILRFVPLHPFQWISAFSLPVFAWQFWLGSAPEWLPLAAVGLGLSWVSLILGAWFRKAEPDYLFPWYRSAHLSAILTLLLALTQPQDWMSVIFLGLSAFYCAAAVIRARNLSLWPACLLFPIGLTMALDLAYLRIEAQPIVLGLVALGYLLIGQALEHWRGWRRNFLQPAYQSLYVLGISGVGVSLIRPIINVLVHGQLPAVYLQWAGGAALIFGIVFALRAGFQRNRFDGYLAAWLGGAACGLTALAFSHGTGRSTAFAALGAWAYILAERGISRFAHSGRSTRYRNQIKTAKQLFRWPLITTAWLVAAGVVFLALFRNLVWLGGEGPVRWAVVALWLTVGLFAVSSKLYFGWRIVSNFLYVAGLLAFLPWSMMIWLIWPEYGGPEHIEGWAMLALTEWLIGCLLLARSDWGVRKRSSKLAVPLQNLAHGMMPLLLAMSLNSPPESSSVTLGLGIVFYAACAWQDWRIQSDTPKPRFLYPTVLLTPLWACFLLASIAPHANQDHFAILFLSFSLPALLIGYWLSHRKPVYRRPFYWLAFLILLPGNLLMLDNPWGLVGALLLSTFVCALSAWLFRKPVWIYPASATLALALTIALDQCQVNWDRLGWGLISLAAVYLVAAWLLHLAATKQPKADGIRGYATPLIVVGIILTVLGLPPSSFDAIGAMIAYAAAAILFRFCAFWLGQTIFLTPTVIFWLISYLALLQRVGPADWGLAIWPWSVLTLLGAVWLDQQYGGEKTFPWQTPWQWPLAFLDNLRSWWALPLYSGALIMACVSGILSTSYTIALFNWALAGVFYGFAIWRFRRRIWLLVSAVSLQLAALAGILALDIHHSTSQLTLSFAPVVWITLLVGIWLEWRFNEGAPREDNVLIGWSRPLYCLVMLDILLLQVTSLQDMQMASIGVTLSNTLIMVLFGLWWSSPLSAAVALFGGVIALGQALVLKHADILTWTWAYSLMASIYGIAGYLLRWAQRAGKTEDSWLNRLNAWQNQLIMGGWMLSLTNLTVLGLLSINLLGFIVRALFGSPVMDAQGIHQVQVIVGVLAVQGIFFLTAAIVERIRTLAYAAVALMLGAWSLEWLLVWGLREVQWYVVPTGIYLLLISYVEWKTGGERGKALTRWLDRVALLLLLGSAFWQSLGDHGGWYALLMGIECLLIIWWGSARRLRRFLYIGVAGMTLNVFGQLIDPLLSVNRWIVFGVGGTILVTLAIWIERRLDKVMAMSEDMRKRLDEWE